MQTSNLQPSTFNLGLIGYPLGHSLSPKIHAAALKACNLQGNYSLFPIPPEDTQGLKDLLAHVRTGEIHGLNVTIPHKQNVIQFMDELTPTAQAIGAVNTICMRENKLIGDNTDAPGFLADLKKVMGNGRSEIGYSALVLGAGGSARAVVYALLNDGWEVTLAARRLEQVQQLANSIDNYQLKIVNSSPFPGRAILAVFDHNTHRFQLVADLVGALPVFIFAGLGAFGDEGFHLGFVFAGAFLLFESQAEHTSELLEGILRGFELVGGGAIVTGGVDGLGEFKQCSDGSGGVEVVIHGVGEVTAR